MVLYRDGEVIARKKLKSIINEKNTKFFEMFLNEFLDERKEKLKGLVPLDIESTSSLISFWLITFSQK